MEEAILLISSKLPLFEKEMMKEMINSQQKPFSEDILKCYTVDCNDFENFKRYVIHRVVQHTADYSYRLWTEIYENLSTEKAKLLAKSNPTAIENLALEKSSLVYGEIDFFSFLDILQRVSIIKGETLVDLGHGTGRGLICASLLYGCVLKELHGIEILPELHNASGIFFPKNATIGPNQCFDDDLMMKIAQRAEEMNPGSRFVTLTKSLPSSLFTISDSRRYAMSWGAATCYIHISLHNVATKIDKDHVADIDD
eukprot:gene9260-19221_t